MAIAPVAKRFSENEKLTGDLQGTDRVTITQQSGATKETVNININELSGYISNNALNLGIGTLVEIGQGLRGTGTVADPLRLDTDYLSTTLIEKSRLHLTVVGNRRTRYLPISRSSLFDTKYYNSSVSIAPPATSVEKTGELKMIRPGNTHAHSLSIGDWDIDNTVDSLQVIERRIDIAELPDNYRVVGIQGNSQNAAIVVTVDVNDGQTWFWYATLKNGSLHEDSFTGLSRIAVDNGSIGNYFSRNAVVAFQTSVGRFIISAVRDNFNPNAGCTLRGLQVIGTGLSAYLVGVTSWTVSSYCGTYSGSAGTDKFKISDKFLGAPGENCELVTNSSMVAQFVNATAKPTSNLQVIQNPNNLNEVYLVIQRDHILNPGNGDLRHYTADLVGRITITAQGTGSFVAVSRYLSNRPQVSYGAGGYTFVNYKQTYRSDDLDPGEGQLRFILQDGSILLVDDRVGGSEAGLLRIRKSIAGKTCYDFRDIHNSTVAAFTGNEQIIDPSPKYTVVAGTKKIYIASPIRVYMNSVEYTIPAQCINMDPYVSSAATYTLEGIPTKKGKHVGLPVKAVYLYAQKSGSTVTLVVSTSRLAESINNTFIASVYYPIDTSKSSILLGQAYSRLGYHRPAYEPQGASVPVSYGHAGSQPNEYWMMEKTADSDQVSLADFDFFVVRYRWTSADLDTRTVMRNEGTEIDVNGFGAHAAPGYTLVDGAYRSPNGYVLWALDNTQGGYESCLVDIKKAQLDRAGNFNIDFFAHWFTQGTIADRVVEVQFATYKGGTMRAENYNWVNDGGTAVQSGTFLCQVDAQSQTSDLAVRGDYVARLDWDRPTQTGTFFNLRPVTNQPQQSGLITFKTVDGSDSTWDRWGAGIYGLDTNTFIGSWINPANQPITPYIGQVTSVLYSKSKDGSTIGHAILLNFLNPDNSLDSTSSKPANLWVKFNNNNSQVFELMRFPGEAYPITQEYQVYVYNSLADSVWKTIMQNAMTTPATLELFLSDPR